MTIFSGELVEQIEMPSKTIRFFNEQGSSVEEWQNKNCEPPRFEKILKMFSVTEDRH